MKTVKLRKLVTTQNCEKYEKRKIKKLDFWHENSNFSFENGKCKII